MVATRTCSHCQHDLPLAAFYTTAATDRRLQLERLCRECKRRQQSSPYASQMISAYPAPTPEPGECMIGDCHRPVDEDHGDLCVGHHWHYVLSPEAQDRCRCGRKLVTMYAQERGTCYVCYAGEPVVTVTIVASMPTITVAVAVTGMSRAG